MRTPRSSCVLPFTQMIVRPDGKLSLCCNDALGQMTLGDLRRETQVEAWNNESYRSVRDRLRTHGRRAVDLCSRCDLVECLPKPRPKAS